MVYADYKVLNSIPVISQVTIGDKSTPVWQQFFWETGEYQEFVRKNGCGHCCATMALNLYGIKIDPHQEFTLCRKLWGEPTEHQGNFQTVSGITKILRHYGVPAEFFGVPSQEIAKKHIEKSLCDGKQVIFWTPGKSTFPESPFSMRAHYVMAVGYTKDGQILVANSSHKMAPTGVQMVDIDTIARALYFGAEPNDKTWGERDFHVNNAGYVVVG
ncbi:MAG: C39 family peptidase [Clostridia bacterium]|nr:C39 family peptidase [Clostridia bacterium]